MQIHVQVHATPAVLRTSTTCLLCHFFLCSDPKMPFVRVFAYNSMQGLGKAGRPQLQEIVRYPNETTSAGGSLASSPSYCGDTFPTVCVPGERVHVRMGNSGAANGAKVHVDAVPPELPLCLVHVEVLVRKARPENALKLLPFLVRCLQGITRLLWRVDCSSFIKQILFHQLAEMLRTITNLFSSPSLPGEIVSLSRDTVLPVVKRLQKATETELGSLVEKEAPSKKKAQKNASSELQMPERFSTYFQSVCELSLACLESSRVREAETTSAASERATSPSKDTPAKQSGKRRRGRGRKRTESESKASDDDSAVKNMPLPWLGHANLSAMSAFLSSSLTTPRSPALSTSRQPSVLRVAPVRWPAPIRRLLVIAGLPAGMTVNEAEIVLGDACRPHSGIRSIFAPTPANEPRRRSSSPLPPPSDKPDSSAGTPAESADTKKTDTVQASEQKPEEDKSTEQSPSEAVSKDEGQEEATPSTAPAPTLVVEKSDTNQVKGYAVVELRTANKVASARASLLENSVLRGGEGSALVVCSVDEDLATGGPEKALNQALDQFLIHRLLDEREFRPKVRSALVEIFRSACPSSSSEATSEPDVSRAEICSGDSLLKTFFSASRGRKSLEEVLMNIFREHAVPSPVSGSAEKDKERLVLTESIFLKLICGRSYRRARLVWKGLLKCGFDFDLQR